MLPEACLETPSGHAGHHEGEYDVNVKIVDFELPDLEGVFGPEVENAVCADGSGSAVIEIEEPNRAVDEGEADGKQGIDGTHGCAVECELQGLVSRFADLPADVAYEDNGKNYGEDLAAGVLGEPGKPGLAIALPDQFFTC